MSHVGCILGAQVLFGLANLSAFSAVTKGPKTDFDKKPRANPVTGERDNDQGTPIEGTLSPG